VGHKFVNHSFSGYLRGHQPGGVQAILRLNLSFMNTARWTAQIDKTTNDFINSFGSLTGEQLNFKPNAEVWSIGQNIDHLIRINSSYFPVLTSLQDGTYKRPFIAKFGFLVDWIGKSILKSVHPNHKKKTKTFPIWEPVSSQISSDIIDRFELHQVTLKQMIVATSTWLDQGVVISSPANKHIAYSLETAFDIIVSHEQRHYEQAKRVLDALKEQKIIV
jgi:hypothetical protein